MELSNISDLITAELSSSFGILLFIAIAAVYTIGQYFILHFSKTETKMTSARNRHLLWATKAITYGQYLLISFFVKLKTNPWRRRFDIGFSILIRAQVNDIFKT